jgi:hypothetical protein
MYHHVKAAKGRRGSVDQLLAGLPALGLEGRQLRNASGLSDGVAGHLSERQGSCTNHNMGALCGEQLGYAASHAASGPGHDHATP